MESRRRAKTGIPSGGAGRQEEDPDTQEIAAATTFRERATAVPRKKIGARTGRGSRGNKQGGPNFCFWQVKYGELLEVNIFFICHNI
jgi:hypothetical protein